MEKEHDYNYGKWVARRNQFLKKCPICFYDFYGRKNKRYCSYGCKTRRANDLASKRRQLVANEINIYQRCAGILKELYPKSSGKHEIPMKQLHDAGFDPYCPNLKMKFNNREGEWMKIGKYVIQIINARETVIIDKMK